MLRTNRYLASLVLILGLISVVIGAVFIYQAVDKQNWISQAMAEEKVTLGLTDQQIQNGEVVDNAQKAQTAADTIREHRRSIAPTYADLLANSGGRFDPTNPQHLSYSQALNMENYLYLSVLSFGVIQEITVTGIILIVIGIALGTTSIILRRSIT